MGFIRFRAAKRSALLSPDLIHRMQAHGFILWLKTANAFD